MSDSPVSRLLPQGAAAPEDLFAQLEQARRALQEDGRQYQGRLVALEESLTGQLEHLFQAFRQLQQETTTRQEELDRLQRQLEREQQRLAQQRSRLARRLWNLRRRLRESAEQTQPQHTSPADGATAEQLRQAEAALAQAEQRLQLNHQQLQQLQEENARWEQRCRELEQQLQQAATASSTAGGDLAQQLEDLRRRYEMAVEDLKAERARAEELEARLEQKEEANSAWGDEANLDWERQKQQLLAALESDFDEDDPEEEEQRIQLEQVIARTDRLLAEKDREIAELKKLLDEQSSTWEGMALGAAAVADLLDKDEIVRQERENLKALQEQWKEKLRQAEVELSLERAKLARQKAEIDDKLHELHQKLAQLEKMSEEARAAAAQNTLTKTRSWLKRLGLLKDDQQ